MSAIQNLTFSRRGGIVVPTADGSDNVHAVAVVAVDASGNITTSGTPTGAAGSPNAAVVSVQGVSGGTPVPVSSSQLPATLGIKTAALSASFTPASDALFPITAQYNSAYPTLADGQKVAPQLNANGQLVVAIGGLGTHSQDITPGSLSSDGIGTSSILFPVASRNLISNGSTFDRMRKPNIFSRLTASATGGSPTLVKSSAGDVCTFWGQNAATITYLQLYNKATAGIIGTDTPTLTFPIPASAAFSPPAGFTGSYFPLGISFAFTTDAAGNTAAAANAVTGFAFIAA